MPDCVVTAEEAVKILENLTSNQVNVRLKKHGKSYEIPVEALHLAITGSKILEAKKASGFGEVFVSGENLAIAATTPAHSSAFDTKGCQYFLVTILNPTWATNPTAIGMSSALTFDGTNYYYVSINGVILSQSVNKDDGTLMCYFLHIGVAAAPENRCPYPRIDDNTKLRLTFTPVGTAESKNIRVSVYGSVSNG